jgi:hypothetical protein
MKESEADEVQERGGSAWEPPASIGHTGAKVQPDDEENITKELVREGAEEADYERRMIAAEDQGAEDEEEEENFD